MALNLNSNVSNTEGGGDRGRPLCCSITAARLHVAAIWSMRRFFFPDGADRYQSGGLVELGPESYDIMMFALGFWLNAQCCGTLRRLVNAAARWRFLPDVKSYKSLLTACWRLWGCMYCMKDDG